MILSKYLYKKELTDELAKLQAEIAKQDAAELAKIQAEITKKEAAAETAATAATAATAETAATAATAEEPYRAVVPKVGNMILTHIDGLDKNINLLEEI